MYRTPKNKLLLGFLTLFTVVLLLSWQALINNRRSQDTLQRLAHSKEVVLLCEEVAALSKDMEREARGYVITGQKEFRDSYQTSSREIILRVQRLRQLTTGQPTQLHRLDTLVSLWHSETSYLNTSIELRTAHGFDAVRKHMQSGDKQCKVNEMQQRLFSIQREETLLQASARQAHKKGNQAFSWYFSTLVVSLLLLITFFFIALIRSLQRRDRAVASLNQSRQQLQAIIDNTGSLIYLKDLTGRYMLANQSCEKILNCSSGSMKGKSDLDLFPRDLATKIRLRDQQVIRSGATTEFVEVLPCDSKPAHFYTIKFPLRDAEGKIYALGGVSTNISGVISREQQKRQRRIAKSVLQAQEKERTTIGRELHDSVSQLLTSAHLLLEMAQHNTPQRPVLLDRSKQVISEALTEVRSISHGLITPFPEPADFALAILTMADNINLTGQLNMAVQLPALEELERLSDQVKRTLYRIIQEQVNNTLKYARATRVTVALSLAQDQVRLHISDNGIGAVPGKAGKGIGLSNIAGRVAQLRGKKKIETQPGKGFSLTVLLPL